MSAVSFGEYGLMKCELTDLHTGWDDEKDERSIAATRCGATVNVCLNVAVTIADEDEDRLIYTPEAGFSRSWTVECENGHVLLANDGADDSPAWPTAELIRRALLSVAADTQPDDLEGTSAE